MLSKTLLLLSMTTLPLVTTNNNQQLLMLYHNVLSRYHNFKYLKLPNNTSRSHREIHTSLQVTIVIL